MVVAGYAKCAIKLKGLVKCDYYHHPAQIFISVAVYNIRANRIHKQIIYYSFGDTDLIYYGHIHYSIKRAW